MYNSSIDISSFGSAGQYLDLYNQSLSSQAISSIIPVAPLVNPLLNSFIPPSFIHWFIAEFPPSFIHWFIAEFFHPSEF